MSIKETFAKYATEDIMAELEDVIAERTERFNAMAKAKADKDIVAYRAARYRWERCGDIADELKCALKGRKIK